MNRLTILIDMDDVLEDLVGCWISELNKKHGTTVTIEDVTDWKIAKFFPTLTNEELYAPLFDPDMWLKLEVMPNAPENVKRLIDDGHIVRIVTATHYGTVLPKMKRFLEMYPFLTWEDVIIASDKSVINGDVMIDDGVHNLESASCIKLLFDRPHNRAYNARANNMIRVKTWEEIYTEISRIAKMKSALSHLGR